VQPTASTQDAGKPGTLSIPEQWLNLHGDALFRYAVMLVHDEHDAEDLVQDTLIAAFEARDQYASAASERTWLIAILRNKAIDRCRRDLREAEYFAAQDPVVEGNFNRFGKWRKPPRSWSPNPTALLESKEFWVVFHGCMRALPQFIREAFALRVVEGIGATEVCRILEISNTNLWTLLYRARERLRRCLEVKWFTAQET
jgi:RNA polymerase sigma-70 factor (ECF subfamily)